jgi:uncharacterized RDD family membrane protein YckC
MEAGAPAPNPYAPPAADLDARTDAPQVDLYLASRWRRLFGALIDGFIVNLGTLGTLIGRSSTLRLRFEGGWWSMQLGEHTNLSPLFIAALFGLWTVQSYFIAVRGQSLGKMVVGTRIVGLDGRRASFGRAVVVRTWLFVLLAFVPRFGSLLGFIDVVLIFGSKRRCLHDWMAGTDVLRIEGQAIART